MKAASSQSGRPLSKHIAYVRDNRRSRKYYRSHDRNSELTALRSTPHDEAHPSSSPKR